MAGKTWGSIERYGVSLSDNITVGIRTANKECGNNIIGEIGFKKSWMEKC